MIAPLAVTINVFFGSVLPEYYLLLLALVSIFYSITVNLCIEFIFNTFAVFFRL